MEKVKGNEGNGIPLPALTGADARAAKKFTELEAGRVLVEQAAKRAEEERERLEEERLEKKEKEGERTYRDTPELSRQGKWFGVEGKLLEEEQLRWVLEMEQELWDAFQNWKPSSYGELARELEELSKLYLALLEAVLTCTTGEEQAVQKDRLDGVLAEKLQLIAEVRLRNLMGLLEQTGQTETLKRVWYSLYKHTTGGNLSSKGLERLLSQAQRGRMREHSAALRQPEGAPGEGRLTEASARGSKAPMSAMEEGSVYKLSGKNGIQMSQEFDVQRRAGVLQGERRLMGGSGGAGQGMGQSVFTGKELEAAEAFARHLQGSGGLFGEMGRGGSAEAAGLFAALISVKGQIYISGMGRTGAMAAPAESLVNRMVDYYLSRKEAYQVYYYTTDLYEKTKDPEKTIEKGLEYAYRLFLEKKSGGDQRDGTDYAKEESFFPTFLGQLPEEELKKALRLLKENWRDFLLSMGEDAKSISLRAQHHSPWGSIVESEKRRKVREEKENRLFKKQILVLTGLVLLYLGWRLFFA